MNAKSFKMNGVTCHARGGLCNPSPSPAALDRHKGFAMTRAIHFFTTLHHNERIPAKLHRRTDQSLLVPSKKSRVDLQYLQRLEKKFSMNGADCHRAANSHLAENLGQI